MALHTGSLKEALDRSEFESMAALARALGKSKATVGRWFNGTGEPETMELLIELAAKLGTTMGYLNGLEDAAKDNAEKLLLKGFRELTPEARQAFIAAISASGTVTKP